VIVTRRTALAAAGAFVVRPRAARAQLTPIRIGLQRSDAVIAVECASELGMFRTAGLDVEVQAFGSSSTAMSAVIAGAIEFGAGDEIQLGNAILRGIPIGSFAGGAVFTTAEPTLVLVTLKSGALRAAKDLEGQTIGVVTLQSQSSIATTEWLRLHGADVSAVKLYEIPFAQMVPAMNRGLLQAALIGEPFYSAAKDELDEVGVPFEAVAKTFYINTYFAMRDWVARNRDTARRLAGALYDAARWTNAHRAESAAIEARWSKLDPDRLRAMARNTFSTTLEPRYLQPVLDLAARYHLLARPLPATDMIVTV
jgi:NitT/TauT family transport system substrate-binding protein